MKQLSDALKTTTYAKMRLMATDGTACQVTSFEQTMNKVVQDDHPDGIAMMTVDNIEDFLPTQKDMMYTLNMVDNVVMHIAKEAS